MGLFRIVSLWVLDLLLICFRFSFCSGRDAILTYVRLLYRS